MSPAPKVAAALDSFQFSYPGRPEESRDAEQIRRVGRGSTEVVN